jgi:hypothetical protein
MVSPFCYRLSHRSNAHTYVFVISIRKHRNVNRKIQLGYHFFINVYPLSLSVKFCRNKLIKRKTQTDSLLNERQITNLTALFRAKETWCHLKWLISNSSSWHWRVLSLHFTFIKNWDFVYNWSNLNYFITSRKTYKTLFTERRSICYRNTLTHIHRIFLWWSNVGGWDVGGM